VNSNCLLKNAGFHRVILAELIIFSAIKFMPGIAFTSTPKDKWRRRRQHDKIYTYSDYFSVIPPAEGCSLVVFVRQCL